MSKIISKELMRTLCSVDTCFSNWTLFGLFEMWVTVRANWIFHCFAGWENGVKAAYCIVKRKSCILTRLGPMVWLFSCLVGLGGLCRNSNWASIDHTATIAWTCHLQTKHILALALDGDLKAWLETLFISMNIEHFLHYTKTFNNEIGRFFCQTWNFIELVPSS